MVHHTLLTTQALSERSLARIRCALCMLPYMAVAVEFGGLALGSDVFAADEAARFFAYAR